MPGRVDLDSLMPRPSLLTNRPTRVKEPQNLMESFKDILSKSLSKVNNLSNESNLLTQKLVTGEIDSIHSVMIAAQKAEIALELAMEIRNKLLQAYDKITTMR